MKKLASLLMILSAVMLSACATPQGTQMGDMEIRSGIIEQITPTQIKSSQHKGIGAILGGIGGAAIGSLMGEGTGKDVMIAAGAIAGTFAGNEVQEKKDQPEAGQQVIVRLNSGVLVSVTQSINPDLRPKMKVYIEGSGTSAKVLQQF